jgi:hypothetical protein
MTVQRREEYTEVVNYDTGNIGPVVVNSHRVETDDAEPYNPAPAMAYQTETVSHDPYAARLVQVVNIQQVIFPLCAGVAGSQSGRGLCTTDLQNHRPFPCALCRALRTAEL